MDNASKALIMAGAILISIAIVGVGVYIFSSTSSITSSGQQQIDATAAQTANSTLRQYTGTRVRGSTVKEFVEYINVLNTNDTFPVDITINGAVSSTIDINSYTNNQYYNVTATDGNADGYYDAVTIS